MSERVVVVSRELHRVDGQKTAMPVAVFEIPPGTKPDKECDEASLWAEEQATRIFAMSQGHIVLPDGSKIENGAGKLLALLGIRAVEHSYFRTEVQGLAVTHIALTGKVPHGRIVS